MKNMKSIKVFKRVAYCLALIMVMSLGFSKVAWTQAHGPQPPLVLQTLDYTENPVDVPNPDRGFERSNDDASGNGQSNGLYGYMRIPASANTLLCQPFNPAYEMTPPFYLGGPGKGPTYLNVPVIQI